MGSSNKEKPTKQGIGNMIQTYVPLGIAAVCILAVFYLYRELSKTKKKLKEIDTVKESVETLKTQNPAKTVIQNFDNRMRGMEQYLNQMQQARMQQPPPQPHIQKQQNNPVKQPTQIKLDEQPNDVEEESDNDSEIELERK